MTKPLHRIRVCDSRATLQNNFNFLLLFFALRWTAIVRWYRKNNNKIANICTSSSHTHTLWMSDSAECCALRWELSSLCNSNNTFYGILWSSLATSTSMMYDYDYVWLDAMLSRIEYRIDARLHDRHNCALIPMYLSCTSCNWIRIFFFSVLNWMCEAGDAQDAKTRENQTNPKNSIIFLCFHTRDYVSQGRKIGAAKWTMLSSAKFDESLIYLNAKCKKIKWNSNFLFFFRSWKWVDEREFPWCELRIW